MFMQSFPTRCWTAEPDTDSVPDPILSAADPRALPSPAHLKDRQVLQYEPWTVVQSSTVAENIHPFQSATLPPSHPNITSLWSSCQSLVSCCQTFTEPSSRPSPSLCGLSQDSSGISSNCETPMVSPRGLSMAPVATPSPVNPIYDIQRIRTHLCQSIAKCATYVLEGNVPSHVAGVSHHHPDLWQIFTVSEFAAMRRYLLSNPLVCTQLRLGQDSVCPMLCCTQFVKDIVHHSPFLSRAQLRHPDVTLRLTHRVSRALAVVLRAPESARAAISSVPKQCLIAAVATVICKDFAQASFFSTWNELTAPESNAEMICLSSVVHRLAKISGYGCLRFMTSKLLTQLELEVLVILTALPVQSTNFITTTTATSGSPSTLPTRYGCFTIPTVAETLIERVPALVGSLGFPEDRNQQLAAFQTQKPEFGLMGTLLSTSLTCETLQINSTNSDFVLYLAAAIILAATST
jgi:hypothetical protein